MPLTGWDMNTLPQTTNLRCVRNGRNYLSLSIPPPHPPPSLPPPSPPPHPHSLSLSAPPTHTHTHLPVPPPPHAFVLQNLYLALFEFLGNVVFAHVASCLMSCMVFNAWGAACPGRVNGVGPGSWGRARWAREGRAGVKGSTVFACPGRPARRQTSTPPLPLLKETGKGTRKLI